MEQFVVGFDLRKEYSQLCFWGKNGKEPESISVVSGSEKYRIPRESLELFLKKSLRLLKPYGKLHEAAALVFSVEELSEELIERIKRAAMQIVGIGQERIIIQTAGESFCSYVLSQPREIWNHSAALFEYEGHCLKASLLHINQKTIPLLARVEEKEEWSIVMEGLEASEKDQRFLELLRSCLEHHKISAAYLVGTGFEEKWYENSLKVLCSGRRVFAGNNLYAKGACYRAAKMTGREVPYPYVYLGADKISYSLGIRAVNGSRDGIHTLLEAGTSWYEAKAECEILLYEDAVAEFILKPMQGKELLKESILLEGLPDRPLRTTRVRVEAEFLSVSKLRICLWDLGFGELFPSSDLCWTEEVEL